MNFNISVHKLTNHNQIIAQENSVLMGFYNNNIQAQFLLQFSLKSTKGKAEGILFKNTAKY